MTKTRKIHWITYISAFIITAIIFMTAIVVNNFFNNRRVEQVRSIEEGISIDILSLETQFELLQEQSCKSITTSPVLSHELNTLARKLSFTEAQLGADNPEVVRLKRQYSLLEIKDFLLMQKVSKKCNLHPIFILYFYSNKNGECPDCIRQGYVLTALSHQYPTLRVYSFDYNINLSAVKTLISLEKIPDELPALVIHDTTYSGFKTIDDVKKLIPQLKILDEKAAASSTATSTLNKISN